MLTDSLLAAKKLFIQSLNAERPPNLTDIEQLPRLNLKLATVPSSIISIIRIDLTGITEGLPVTNFLLAPVDTTTWLLRRKFIITAPTPAYDAIHTWIANVNAVDRPKGLSAGASATLNFMYAAEDSTPLATLHGIYPINAQIRPDPTPLNIEDREGVVHQVPYGVQLRVVFEYNNITLDGNKAEPFEFMKNDPLPKLPSMLDHTRGGQF